MRIINHGHACFQIIGDDLSIVFDPYKDNSVPGLNIRRNIEANFCYCSHSHYDHNAIEKVNLLLGEKEEIRNIAISLPHDKNNGKDRGFSIARIFYYSDYSICHLGDIGDVRSVINDKRFKNIDIVLCPINGFYTISAKEAAKLQKEMNWKILIPMHYEIEEKGIGYPDNGQINIFKSLYNKDEILEIDDFKLEMKDEYFKYKTLIFLKSDTE